MSIQVGNPLLVLLLVSCYLPRSSDDFFFSLGPSLVDFYFFCDCAWQHEPLIDDTFVQVFGPMLIKFVIALLLLLYLTHQGMDFFSELGLVLQMNFVLLFCLAT